MNAKYQHLQQKIQMLTKSSQDTFYKHNNSNDSNEDIPSPLNASKHSGPSFTSSMLIHQYASLEIRLANLESLYENSLSNIDMKYTTLSEYISKIKQSIDSSLITNDSYCDEQLNTINSINTSLLNQLAEDNQVIDNYLENSLQKASATLIQVDNELTGQTEVCRKECYELEENTKTDLQGIDLNLGGNIKEKTVTNAQLEKEIGDRLNEEHTRIQKDAGEMDGFYNEQYDKIRKMTYYTKQKCEGEKMKRIEFKENIVKVLKETEDNLQEF